MCDFDLDFDFEDDGIEGLDLDDMKMLDEVLKDVDEIEDTEEFKNIDKELSSSEETTEDEDEDETPSDTEEENSTIVDEISVVEETVQESLAATPVVDEWPTDEEKSGKQLSLQF